MQHVSPYSKFPGFEEWLIYFECPLLRTTFTISFVGPESKLTGTGSYSFPRRGYELSLSLEGLGKRVTVETKLDKSNRPMQKFFQNGSQSGIIVLDPDIMGTCIVRNNYFNAGPAVQISNKARDCMLTATKSEPRDVSCPLVVEGLTGAEMILEDYSMLNRSRRLLALVAIVEILVKPQFMNVEAA
jgi:hypothetical protein